MELIQENSKRFRLHVSKELTAILIVIAIFLVFPYLVRQVDYSAAAIDPGILSAIILALVAVLIFQAVTWWVIRIIWPVFYTYSIHHFESNFKSLESWKKVCIYLAFYSLLLFAFIVTLAGII